MDTTDDRGVRTDLSPVSFCKNSQTDSGEDHDSRPNWIDESKVLVANDHRLFELDRNLIKP